MIAPGTTSQQENVLKAGVETISAHQTVTFTKYYRMILPMDGYLFWVNANILAGNSGEPNVPPLNTAMPNQPAMPNGPTRFGP